MWWEGFKFLDVSPLETLKKSTTLSEQNTKTKSKIWVELNRSIKLKLLKDLIEKNKSNSNV